MKWTDEAGRPAKAFVEPRAGAKENAEQGGTPRTPSRQRAPHGLDRVRQAVRFAANIQGGSRMPQSDPSGSVGGRSTMGVPTAIDRPCLYRVQSWLIIADDPHRLLLVISACRIT